MGCPKYRVISPVTGSYEVPAMCLQARAKILCNSASGPNDPKQRGLQRPPHRDVWMLWVVLGIPKLTFLKHHPACLSYLGFLGVEPS